MPFTLRGERVLLRDWRDDDLPAWVAMNADPAVRRYFPSVLDEAAALGEASRIRAHAEREGFTFWALEIPGVADFAGFVGLIRTGFDAHFTPCVEIGWRLAQTYWGQGYASGILQHIYRYMRQADAPLLLISGIKSLYARTGCVPFGRTFRFALDASAADAMQRSGAEGIRIREMQPADLYALHELASRRQVRYELSVRELGALIKADAQRLGKLVRDAGVTVD